MMNVADAREVFLQALDCASPGERRAFLERACAGDAALRAEVDELLEAHEQAGGFLAGLAVSTLHGEFDEESPGGIIGRYKLLQKIGEGGFGVVYMAEQREPVRRRVALKVIKMGMDTRQVVARFEAERQALALMDHPNIARVLDAGATTTGRPYFVMELVRGVPITEFCDANRLRTDARVRLMIDVCQAIHHAHQKGIIHRDIKPTNVLVADHDGHPVPKVIDFGVAKAIQQDLTEKTIFTRFHEFIGTPAYMSPEQAQMSGLDVDTRSDIYSLGVLLYELLAGHPPFESRELLEGGYDAMRKRIREEEPAWPSTRLQTLALDRRAEVARARGTHPERLRKILRGELDWIVLKCLEKDRARRYESAAALAQDLERCLRDEPVTAAAPGVWYKGWKFTVRHKRVVLGSAALTVLLLSGALVSTYFAIQATHAERRARREAAIAEAVTRFLNEDFFGQVDPAISPVPELRLRTSLDRAASQIEHRFRGQPLVEAAVQSTIGELYSKLGEYEAAERHLNRAYELRFHELGEENLETAEVMMDLAFVLLRLRRNEDARSLGERALALVQRLHGDDNPDTARFSTRMAWVYYTVGESAAGFALAHKVLALAAARNDISAMDRSQALQLAARAVGAQDRQAGEGMLRQALALMAADQGETHPRTMNARNNLAAYFLDHGYNLDEARALLLEAFEQHRRTFGEAHDLTIQVRGNLVLLYRKLNDLKSALVHQLAIVEYRGERARQPDLDVLRWLLGAAKPESLLGDEPDWRGSRQGPISAWRFPEFDDSGWTKQAGPAPGATFLRHTFQLESLPEAPPLFVVFGAAEISAWLNGVPIPRSLFRKSHEFQVAILDKELMAALREGLNILAVQFHSGAARVQVDLLEHPQPGDAAITKGAHEAN